MSESSEKKAGNFLPGLIFGAIAGAVAGILFAPDKGEKTREKLQKEYEGLRHQARAKLTELNALQEEHFPELPARVRDKFDGIKAQVSGHVADAKANVKRRLAEKALEDKIVE